MLKKICCILTLLAGLLAGCTELEGPTGDSATLDAPTLTDAIDAQDADAMTALLDAGADPNTTDADGTPTLHYAIAHGATEQALQLMRAGADIEALDAAGLSPLEVARQNANLRMESALLAAGAHEPTAQCPNGHTDIKRVHVLYGNVDMTHELRKKVADGDVIMGGGMVRLTKYFLVCQDCGMRYDTYYGGWEMPE